MKIFTIPAAMAMLASTAFAHSWLECVDTRVPNKAAAQAHPADTRPVEHCKGYPRNKVDNGNWIAESSNYAYGFSEKFACRNNQRVPGQTAPSAPMATASPGDKLLMRFWGNGHSTYNKGSPKNRDPGLVRIFWAGKPGKEIVYASDLTEKYWIPGAQGNFSGDAVNYINAQGKLVEPANYFVFHVPEKIQNGRHMMVWAWAWKASMIEGATHGNPDVYDAGWDNAWGTCFDIQIVNSKYTAAVNTDILGNQKGFDENKYNKKKETEICSQKCFRGGMKDQPCSGASCPPCWYRNEGQTNCFAYNGAGQCPFPGGWDCSKGASAVSKREALHAHARKHRRANKF